MTGRQAQGRGASASRFGAALAAAMLASAPGCDHFRVESFHGSKVLMDLSGAHVTAAGHHIELWVRDAENATAAGQNLVRVRYSDGGKEADLITGCLAGHTCGPMAYAIVPALGPFRSVMGSDGKTHAQLEDGCMIDEQGHLVWTPDALDPATHEAQGPLGAATIQRRIDELTIGTPLYAFVPWDDGAGDPNHLKPGVDETLPAPTDPSCATERLCRCRAFWASSAASYTANVRQLTAPRHGALLGVLDYVSLAPPQILGGISFPSDWSLPDPQELWLTDTTASVGEDCVASPARCGGTVILDGEAMTPGRGAVQFDLRSPLPPDAPLGGMQGSATLEIGLDQDPQQF